MSMTVVGKALIKWCVLDRYTPIKLQVVTFSTVQNSDRGSQKGRAALSGPGAVALPCSGVHH